MDKIILHEADFEISAIRASGPGGQHVNKVSTAIQLRFDIAKSSLSDNLKNKLLKHADKRISKEGILLIKAQRFRSQDKNRQDAIARLEKLLAKVNVPRKRRIATRPSRRAKEKRLKDKKHAGEKKQGRSAKSSLDNQ